MQNGGDAALLPTLSRLQAGLQQLRALLPPILALKQSANPDPNELSAAILRASSLFIELRDLHRSLCADIENAKGETTKGKAESERIALLLQNLKYEEAHFLREINVCQDYKREAEIPLVSEDEFRAQAPPELNQATDAHHLMTNRLTFEFKSRKALLAKVAELKAKKKTAQEAVDAKKKLLESFNTSVTAIEKSSFGLHITQRAKQYALAQHLSPPLYLLFNHIKAYNELFDKDCDASITGSADAALAFRAEHHRLTTTPASSLPAQQLYTEWPLALQVELKASAKDILTLVFRYFPALEVVSVAVTSPSYERDSLCMLYPGDDGLSSGANLRNQMALEDFRWDNSRPDRAYRWVQWICGMYSPDQVPPTTQETFAARTIRKHLKAVITAIRRRMKTRATLQTQLDQLGKFQLPGAAASPPYRVALSAWRKSLPPDFEAAAQGRAIPPPSTVFGIHFYRFTYTRDDEQLEGHVRISVAYPQEAPRFLLRYSGRVARKTGQLPERTLSDSDSLALENDVNSVYAPEDSALLTLQLRRLQASFDRMLDERQKTLPSASSAVAPAQAAAPAPTSASSVPEPTPMQH